MTTPSNEDQKFIMKFTNHEPNVLIELYRPKYMKRTRWNRFKVAVWNFVLPPHVHLNLPEKGNNDD